jgi:predicted MFS family arabinose efflux permease
MLFGLGGLVFAGSASRVVAALGESGLARWGGLLLAGALLLIGIAPNLWWALPGCLASGLGFYMLHNTLQINATQMAPERRGAAVASFASCFYLGQSVGVAVAGALVERTGTAAIIVLGAGGVLLLSQHFGWRRGQRPRVPAM